jgi:hypothetical protein
MKANIPAGSRGAVIHAWGKDTITPKEKISASSIAGGIAGTCGGLLSELFFNYYLWHVLL